MLCALSRKVGVMKMEWLHSSKWRGYIPPTVGGTFPLCVGTFPFCVGTFPLCVGTKPFCVGTKPFCVGTKPLCVGTKPFCVGTFPLCVGCIPNIWAGYSHYLGWIFPLSGLDIPIIWAIHWDV